MSLPVGTRIGPYEIVSAIGAGGMGEVYRARDARLNRDVAVKILPDVFANDPERLARFTREAQTLASLNHPGIAQIHGLEERALVMELVEGDDLSVVLARGAMPLPDALPIAKQIAEALEAAHEQGIVHRDLKPANIKVRPDGTVKVLDFGLAKAMEPAGASSAEAMNSPTLTARATQMGVLLGTAAYMAPEQARGKVVDRRADVWAFGAVLFEMLTGTRAFPGEDITDTLAAVVRAEPDWQLLPKDLPPTLQVYLRRCLQKDPKQRVGDIHDVRLALEGAFDTTTAAASPTAARPAPSRTRERVAWAAALATAVLAALAIAASAFLRPPAADTRQMRFFLSAPDGWNLSTTPMINGGSQGPLAVSPDGTRIAFVANMPNGRGRLWVRPLDTLAAQELPGTDGAVSPFWSPDSRSLGFFADGKLKRIDVAGGPPLALCDSPASLGGTWNRDGVILFSPGSTSALSRVSASGGVPRAATVLTPTESFHGRPSFLPDGRHFIYRVGNGGVYIGALDANTRTPLLENPDNTNVLYAMGHLLFLRETTLMAQPFDANRLTLTGEPVPIAEQIQTVSAPPYAFVSASDTGVLVYQTGATGGANRELAWFDRAGKALGTVDRPGLYNTVELSPDGTRVAVSHTDPRAAGRGTGGAGNVDLVVHEFARTTTTRFTFDASNDTTPVWSADGTHIAWSSNRDGPFDLFAKVSNGAGADESLLKSGVAKYPTDSSPDGRFLLYNTFDAGSSELWVLPLTGSDRKPWVYLKQPGFSFSQARFSPDGRFVVYTANKSGSSEVYVQPFPTATAGKWMVSQGGGSQARWPRGAGELFYISADSNVMAVPVTPGPDFKPGVAKALFPTTIWGGVAPMNVTRYDVTADGKKFLINQLPKQTTTSGTANPMTVVLNWAAGLPR